jgi:hypothetical protein
MRKAQVIDLTRSYVPVDPESFYENMMITGQEDSPERLLQIVPYEGYNFLPAVYGYKSFFDTSSKLDVDQITGVKVSHIFLFQLSNYTSHLIALAEDGAYFCDPQTSSAAWTRLYTAGTSASLWTYCVIENNLYIYRQGASSVCKVPYTGTIAAPGLVSITPSYLTMAGQMGIFRANGRLGFWDSSNVITWTSLFDFTDATPSISTLAASVLFNDILGKIVSVRSFGDGFVIYSTKNIVGAEFDTQGSILFRARALAESAGIWDSRQCCVGSTDIEQYAYTNTGIKRIHGNMQVENIFPSVFDLLKESRDPVFVNLINGRFLFLSTPDSTYIYNKTTHAVTGITSLTIRFLSNGNEVTDVNDLPDSINGLDLSDDLKQQVVLLNEDVGLYTQWNASGAVMVSGRDPSSMDPYVLDDPSTPDDDYPYTENRTALMTTAELIAIRDATTPVFVSPMNIDESTPLALDLGWQRSVSKGAIDIPLSRFKERQEKEFTEYYANVTDLAAVITGLGSSETKTRHTNTDYAEYSAATTATPSDIALAWTKIGDIYQGGSATQETFTGVGTNSPTWKYEKTFTNGYDIEHGIQTDYYLRRIYFGVIVEGYVDTQLVINTTVHTLEYTGHPNTAQQTITTRVSGWTANEIVDGKLDAVAGGWFTSTFDVDTDGSFPTEVAPTEASDLTIISTMLNTMKPIAQGWTISPPSSIWITPHWDTAGTYAAECLYTRTEVNDFGTVAYYQLPFVAPFDYEIMGWAANYSITYGWGIHKTVTKQLRSTYNASMTPVKAKAQASQRNIEWCNYLIDNPNSSYPYDTNDLIIPLTISSTPSNLPPYVSYTYPGATFNLQNGALGAAYPTLVGSFVYDTQLQKWGKQKNDFYALLDYTPVNSTVEKLISFTNLGMDAGIITTDGWVKLFGWQCSDSFIRYGKIGLNRQGFSNIDEIGFNFREPFTGEITIDYSIDGRNIQASLQQVETFLGEGYVTVYPAYAGRWYTVGISGTFDIRSMSLAAMAAGMR